MANDASRGSYIAVGGEAHDIELSEAPHGYPSEEGTAAAIEDLKEKDEAQVPLSIVTLISGFIIPCIWAAGFLYVLRSLLGAYGVLTGQLQLVECSQQHGANPWSHQCSPVRCDHVPLVLRHCVCDLACHRVVRIRV